MMRQIEFGVKLYLLLHVAVAISNSYKVTGYTKMYQGTKVPPHRYLQYTNIDLYTIHIASISLFPFFRNDLQLLVLGQDGASFVPGLASPIPCPLLLSFREIHGYTIQYFTNEINF
jgi:hypothetical protein